MPKFKTLSGKEAIKIFEVYGFSVVSQKGSHVKLCRVLKNEKQTLVVPKHHELDIGTLGALFRQAGSYISHEELEKEFCEKK